MLEIGGTVHWINRPVLIKLILPVMPTIYSAAV